MAKVVSIGNQGFDTIRMQDSFYIDKTKLIEQLLNGWGKVSLFTWPRRFGKSLPKSYGAD